MCQVVTKSSFGENHARTFLAMSGTDDLTTEDLFRELTQSGSESLFNEIAQALTSKLELHDLLRTIVERVSTLFRPTHWSLVLRDECSGFLHVEIAVGRGTDKLLGRRIEPDFGLIARAVETGEGQISSNPAIRSELVTTLDNSDDKIRNAIAVPLKSHGVPLGVLELVNPVERCLKGEYLNALKTVADYAAIAIENAKNFQKIRRLTIVDEHTGLYNARHLNYVVGTEMQRAERFGRPLSLLFLDLDDFKMINDNHGHLAGSAILAEFGEFLRGNIRQVDAAFRYGGDEFALMLVETSNEGAVIVAKRIQELLAERRFLESRGLAIKLSASVGISSFPEDGRNTNDLLHTADLAMYQAKQKGKNIVMSTRVSQEGAKEVR